MEFMEYDASGHGSESGIGKKSWAQEKISNPGDVWDLAFSHVMSEILEVQWGNVDSVRSIVKDLKDMRSGDMKIRKVRSYALKEVYRMLDETTYSEEEKYNIEMEAGLLIYKYCPSQQASGE